MNEQTTRWLGAAVLLVGLLSLAGEALSLIGPHGLLAQPGASFGVVLAASVFFDAATLLLVGVRFWMWRFARQTPGADALLLAAIGGVVAMVSFEGTTRLVLPIASSTSSLSWLVWPLVNSINYVTPLLLAATLGAFCVGLRRAGVVPTWIVWLGLAAVGALVLSPALGLVRPGSAGLTETLYSLLNAAFLLSLGVFLLRRRIGNTPPRPHIAVALLSVLTTLVAVAGLASWSGVRADAADNARLEAANAYPSAFARLFPGFTDAAAGPSGVGGGPSESAEATLQWFKLKRGGAPFMPVAFINRLDQVSETQGPVRGTPIAFQVRGGGRWYLGDNYFVSNPASRYAKIPQAQKLALWDAFARVYPDESRVLGIFPIAELRDRTLLRADGLAPEALDDCTLVVYTTEFSSAIAEEVAWGTVDELIVNGRAYESGPDAAQKDPTHRLLVAAFRWTGSGWIAVEPAKP
jgi:hypothetical protein